jgi:hypothetical protein
MKKRHLSLTVEASTYQAVKNSIPEGQISPLVNQLLKEHLKRQKQEQLTAAYKRTAASKARKEEDQI